MAAKRLEKVKLEEERQGKVAIKKGKQIKDKLNKSFIYII
jgi:hypothetical protein